MKRLLLLAVTVLLICSPLAVCYAEEEIYWEGTTPGQPTITDKDFRLDFKTPAAKSLGDLEIYDHGAKDIFEDEESAAPPQPTAPAAQAEPQLRPPIQPRGFTRPSTEAVPSVQRATPRAPEIVPQASETSPGTNESTTLQRKGPAAPQVQQSNEAVSAPASTEDLDRTGQKKMKWGQVDVKPSEPKDKFRWGQQ